MALNTSANIEGTAVHMPCWNCCVVFMALLVFLGVSTSSFAQRPATTPQTVWVAGEHSSGKRPIEVARFGSGEQFVLIVGSLAGNDPASIELLDATCQLAKQFPPPSPVTLLFVRTPNPDGWTDHVHTNAHGVELERNFPTRNFTTAPTRLTGLSAGSEPETRYMLRILAEFKPVSVIHVRSGMSEQPIVLMNDHWQRQFRSAVLPQDVRQDRYHSAFKAGSLEEYVSLELKKPVCTVYLSKGSRPMLPAEILRLAVGRLAQEAKPSGDIVTSPDSTPVPDSPTSMKAAPTTSIPEATAEQVSEAASPEDKSSVVLLPPPPEFLATSKSTIPSETMNSRFVELPSPKR
jgi:protein MpaA